MDPNKRLQVFISSTYRDLEDERQVAVSTILSAGHIPAGMELFAAGDQSQMEVIRNWIDESDIFMLILGGRYGSIEPLSQKSYTQLEYEYALEKHKPLFSVVLNDAALADRAKRSLDFVELENRDKLKIFREMVTGKLVEFWSDARDIERAIYKSLNYYTARVNFTGWLRGDEIEKVRTLAAERISYLEKQLHGQEDKIKQLEKIREATDTGKSAPLTEESTESLSDASDAIDPLALREAFALAIGNVTNYGDTDVFPFPIENFVFFDRPDESIGLLEDIHRQTPSDFKILLGSFLHEEGLAAVGYNGFRWATQMDPLWNAYLLGLVITIGAQIENARVPIVKNIVFSYRFKPDFVDKTLFDREVGWVQFQNASLKMAENYTHVLVCDIADYYLHINHRHLYNSLKRVVPKSGIANRIMDLLRVWSKGVGYGLPVGGPSARLLSELLLNDVDRLLLSARVSFHRFVDDYCIFARSEQEARSHLALLSELLLEKDSLPLQKAKTRILSSEEFRSLHDPESADDETEALDRHVLRLRLHFDPYSPTSEDDYEALTTEMSKYPIEEMLARQMRKSRIDQAVTKKLINMVKFQEDAVRNQAIASIIENLVVLYPVFPTVMLLLKGVMSALEEALRQNIFKVLRELIAAKSHIVRVPANLVFAVRVLSQDSSEETVQVLAGLYQDTNSMMLRRDIILGMARNAVDYWTSARLRDFDRATPWERRALLIASYTLGDEGRDFRGSVEGQLQPIERLASTWAAERLKRGALEIPI